MTELCYTNKANQIEERKDFQNVMEIIVTRTNLDYYHVRPM